MSPQANDLTLRGTSPCEGPRSEVGSTKQSRRINQSSHEQTIKQNMNKPSPAFLELAPPPQIKVNILPSFQVTIWGGVPLHHHESKNQGWQFHGPNYTKQLLLLDPDFMEVVLLLSLQTHPFSSKKVRLEGLDL